MRPHHDMLCALRQCTPDRQWLDFYRFVETALYAPGCGYYANPSRQRIGRSRETDFYTSESFPLFRHLVLAAVRTLTETDFRRQASFIELGLEHTQADLEATDFASCHGLGSKDTPVAKGPCVIFSNELFDAQPFDRLIFHQDQWHIAGIAIGKDGSLQQTLRPAKATASIPLPADLPTSAPEGYTLDIPRGAETLLEHLCQQSWHGLFLAFDYGTDWASLTRDYPEGTARAYAHHRQYPDVIAHPGERDITHHICWDHMETILRQNGFHDVSTLRQEAFFLKHAQDAITRYSADPRTRRTLMELLHPAYLGTRFQVLCAWRDEPV